MSTLTFTELQEMSEELIIAAVDTCGLPSLTELETIIWTNIDAGTEHWLTVGNALMEIQTRELYKETHRTFEAYCKKRWGFTRQTAYRKIKAAFVTGVLQSKGKPVPKSQTKALATVPKKKRNKKAKPDPEPVPEPTPEPEPTPGELTRTQKLKAEFARVYSGDFDLSASAQLSEYDLTLWGLTAGEIRDLAAWLKARQTGEAR